MIPLYIVDIDGTVALIDHRLHYLDNIDDLARWDKFYNECHNDEPNLPVINTINLLLQSGADIWFFTGRKESIRVKTVNYLTKYINIQPNDLEDTLLMRPEGNRTPDNELKLFWYSNMLDYDKSRLQAVFEDRDRVVGMWRENNVACFQVNKGEF